MNWDKWIYMIRNLPAEMRSLLHPSRKVSGVWSLGGIRFSPALSLRALRADGQVLDLGVVSRRVVTDVGVAALVDDWDDNSQDITAFNFHGLGSGSTAESQTDTDLVTPFTTQLNPDSTRATGTKSQPAANQIRSVGTNAFDAAVGIEEHGLFNNATVGSGILWDRSVFAVINLASGDSLESTYTLTVSAGG